MEFHTDDIARAVRGTVHGPPTTVDGTAVDSRTLPARSLFVPLVAERDGHDFIDAALGGGAAATLTARPDTVEDGGTRILVPDTLEAFERLGGLARDRLQPRADHHDATVIGITGSVGKTSVKDLLASVLSTTFRTTASAKSFNNEIGVPLTLTNAPADTEVLVQEMGARGIGHIDRLCRIARPSAAIVTMVAAVHTSEFAGLDEVEQAKGELVEAVPVDGVVILNSGDPRVLRMASRTDARVLTYGVTGDVVAQKVGLDDDLRPRFRLASAWGNIDITLSVHGVHQVANALAAAAAGLAHGVSLEGVAEGLATATLSPWRMEMHRSAGGAVIINDAYNANPTSVRAALQSLAAIARDQHIAILGPMAELGPDSDDLHAEIGRDAERLGIDVISVDCPAYDTGVDVADLEGVLDVLGDLDEDDAILVKASRSAGLETIAEALLHR